MCLSHWHYWPLSLSHDQHWYQTNIIIFIRTNQVDTCCVGCVGCPWSYPWSTILCHNRIKFYSDWHIPDKGSTSAWRHMHNTRTRSLSIFQWLQDLWVQQHMCSWTEGTNEETNINDIGNIPCRNCKNIPSRIGVISHLRTHKPTSI